MDASCRMDKMCGIETYLVKNAPDTIYYIPDFISEQEEEYLIRHVNDSPKPKWTQLLNRRLQNWGGLPHQKGMITEAIPEWLNKYCAKISDLGAFEGKSANHVLVNEYHAGQGIMPHLDGDLYYPTVSTVTLGSHTLLNFYHPLRENSGYPSRGDTTVVPQSEQSQHGTSYSTVAINADPVSTDFTSRHVTSVLLERRSLVLLKDSMYNTYLHGIDEAWEDTLIASAVCNLDSCRARAGQTLERAMRISLTIRHVPKVLKVRLPFGNKR